MERRIRESRPFERLGGVEEGRKKEGMEEKKVHVSGLEQLLAMPLASGTRVMS